MEWVTRMFRCPEPESPTPAVANSPWHCDDGAALAKAVGAVSAAEGVKTTVTVGEQVAFTGSVDPHGLRALLFTLPMVSADTATVAFKGYTGVFYRGGGGKPVDEFL